MGTTCYVDQVVYKQHCSDSPDLKYVTDRLLENPLDFEDELKQFYGDAKAAKFKELLTEHLMIGGDLVNAANQGDTQLANQMRERWYANADSIANFLASINPYWSRRRWRSMLYDHLKLTEEEAATRIEGNYQDNVKIYDTIEKEALDMADYMHSGIVRQFRM